MRARPWVALTALLGAVLVSPSAAGADPGTEPDLQVPVFLGSGGISTSVPTRGRMYLRPVATDNVAVVRFELLVDGVLVASDDSPRDYDMGNQPLAQQSKGLLWDTAGTNGPVTVTLRAYDAANNVGDRQIAVTVDNVAPVAAMTIPSHNGFVHGVVPITFTGDSTVDRIILPYLNRYLDPSGPAPWVTKIDTAGMSSLSVSATAYDQAGNFTPMGRAVGVDNSPPTMTLRRVAAPGAPVRGQQLIDVQTFDWNEVTVDVLVNGRRVDWIPTPDRATVTSRLVWYATGLQGPVKLTVRATDWFGQRRENIRTVIADHREPTVSIGTAPKHKAKVKGKVRITAKAADQYGVSRVELLVNGKVAGRDTRSGYAFTLDTARQKKTMKVRVRAYDRAGNVRYTSSRTWYRR
ncbi:Ig-like domain-containing protein [Jidongwangia harbinensis]|uniref:Ig-like domain-containing protein n=1 Tax=Jidongwangia harbinensis TaxID=2878561 RepID=UPI001CDA1FF5|nr:Ig-like domain-containing protein [Jidongwangia harbinensis]MCA2217411.1 hypothetical protein [Jidongwangia harbinensis]